MIRVVLCGVAAVWAGALWAGDKAAPAPPVAVVSLTDRVIAAQNRPRVQFCRHHCKEQPISTPVQFQSCVASCATR